jgi:hypothetical protein
MKPLTATRSILFVEALYSVRSTVLSPLASEVGATRVSVRHTSGDSSLSTCRACSAEEARRSVGSGMSMTLFVGQRIFLFDVVKDRPYSEQGNSGSTAAAILNQNVAYM